MPLPKPPVDLAGHCSVAYDDTLYIYSPAGFQSLPLKQNASWKVLSPGVSVTGGVCVLAEPADPTQAALYIVGGASNSSTPSYPGLQRYSFKNSTWETITPVVTVTQNRQNHGAAYINSSQQILVYAGSQMTGDNGPSSQTFLISTTPPFNALSFTSTAPPLTAPMIMPLNDSHAVMIGGGADNRDLFVFNPDQGWRFLGTSLTQGITDQKTVRCAVMTGDDGSKVLETYNMGVTPNNVKQNVLLTASGQPGTTGQTVGTPPANRKRKRGLAIDNWPTYNDTLAPSVSRSGYSLAETSDGLAIITGGSSEDPIAIFDQRANSWVNASNFLGNPSASATSLPSVSVVAPTAKASTSSTSAAATSAGISRHTLTVLGGILGGIFGLAALLVVILVVLKWQREKKVTQRSYVNEKDDRLSFADQGADFMHEAGGSVGRKYSASLMGTGLAHVSQVSMNRDKTGKSNHVRAMPSDSSQLGLLRNARNPLGARDPLEMGQMEKLSRPSTSRTLAPRREPSPPHAVGDPTPLVRTLDPSLTGGSQGPERSRSNGWSRYFANNEVTNLASMQSADRNTVGTRASSRRSSEFSRSDYNDSRVFSGSATMVKPLELNLGPKFDGQRLSRVVSGSPKLGRSFEDVREAQSAEISLYDSTGGNFTGTFDFSDHTTSEKADTKSTADTKSVGSNYSQSTNPFFTGGVHSSHTHDPTTIHFTPLPRKSSGVEPPPPLYPGPLPFAADSNRASDASATTEFPGGTTATGLHAADTKLPAPSSAYEFPMPATYFADGERAPRASVAAADLDSPTFPAFSASAAAGANAAKPRVVDVPRGPPPQEIAPPPPASTARAGPSIRKMTGSEDMSWLNINAGR